MRPAGIRGGQWRNQRCYRSAMEVDQLEISQGIDTLAAPILNADVTIFDTIVYKVAYSIPIPWVLPL